MMVAVLFVPNAYGASQKLQPTPELRENKSCNPIGKGAAMSAAARRINGKVLSASLNMRARPPVYRVKVLTDSGRVRYIYVNACTGRLG
ncbi:hypothetical protein DZA50_06510 [Kangiella sp. HD9-110m-PIT-SAG07]|nr:hypothetical protein DZA50_06510 [Kangiella sp. HD9-110m-PIT-SAG07]